MQIELISIGKPKSPWLKEGMDHYKKLLSKYATIKLTTIRESDSPNLEDQRIRQSINPRSLVVLLDVLGKSYDSEAFAKFLDRSKQTSSSIQFVIGGAFGLSESLKREFRNHLSLSPLTFPHEMTVVILLEQLYRAYSISAGTKYHK